MPPALPAFHPAVEPLLESSWQAGLLALLVLAVQTVLRRHLTPAWRHALWWIVLGRLLILLPPASPWSLFNLLPHPQDPVLHQPVSLLAAEGWQPIPAPEVKAAAGAAPTATTTTPSTILADRSEAAGFRGTHQPATALTPQRLGSILTGIWATGTLLLLGRLALQNLRFARRVRALMRPASPALQARLDACRLRMRVGRPVELLEGDAVPSPAVYGLLRPRLLLPRHVAASGAPDGLDSIFLHELAHLRRGDLWVHALTRVLHALHWFNPVLAWAFRRLRLDRELATDALALEVAGLDHRRAYGLTILELLERWSKPAPQPGTVGILEDNTSLERRIRAIAEFQPAPRWEAWWGILLAVLAAASWTGAQAPVSDLASHSVTHAEALALQQRIRDAQSELDAGHAQGDPPSGRERIQALLESIRLPEVSFDRVPLKVVVRQLRDWSRERDPAGHGINLFINPYLDNLPPAPARIDPHTGEVVAPPSVEPIPLGDVLVRIEPPLRDVRLLDVLTALTESAESPIHFTVEDYAVVFLHGPPRPKLVTRVFRISPQGFAHGLESTLAIRQTNAPASDSVSTPAPVLQAKVRQFFQDLGVGLLPPNAVYFNDRRGLLMVRATEPEIEIIELAIEALNEDHVPVWVPATNAPPTPVPPSQPGATSVVPPDSVLTLLPDGPWMLNGQPVHEAGRESDLRALRRLHPEGPQHLRIKVDLKVGWRDLAQAVDLARKAGFEHVAVNVIESPGTEGSVPGLPVDRSFVR